jgi:hypothetical protein
MGANYTLLIFIIAMVNYKRIVKPSDGWVSDDL